MINALGLILVTDNAHKVCLVYLKNLFVYCSTVKFDAMKINFQDASYWQKILRINLPTNE